MIKKEYRLEDYIITEYDQCIYTWEMNIVLGEHRVGNCFIIGNILIMEPWSHEKDGCLKLEFHEYLRMLPVWNKSRYYCFSPSLRNTGTEQTLSNYFNRLQTNKNKITIEPVKILEPKNFRLARYKIIVGENGTVSWQIYEQLNKIKGGLCIIESGTLFISSQNNEVYETQSKKEWITKLRLLSKWDKTFAWGHFNALRACVREKEIKKTGPSTWDSGRKKILISDHMLSSKKQDNQREKTAKLLPSNFDRLRMSFYQTDRWKDLWDRFFPLLIDRLQFGIRFFLYFLKKIVFWGYKMKAYFLKHHKK